MNRRQFIQLSTTGVFAGAAGAQTPRPQIRTVPVEFGSDKQRHRAIWLPRLREDGLMALAAETQGECWTQPATFTGSRLRINSWGKSGRRVTVELTDSDGQPVLSFSLDECDGQEGDQLWQPMSWRGQVNVAGLEGRLIRMRFVLRRVPVRHVNPCASRKLVADTGARSRVPRRAKRKRPAGA